MKYLILIAVLISGCILEPRPEQRQMYNYDTKNTDICGEWNLSSNIDFKINLLDYTIDSTFFDGFSGLSIVEFESTSEASSYRYRYINGNIIIHFGRVPTEFHRN